MTLWIICCGGCGRELGQVRLPDGQAPTLPAARQWNHIDHCPKQRIEEWERIAKEGA